MKIKHLLIYNIILTIAVVFLMVRAFSAEKIAYVNSAKLVMNYEGFIEASGAFKTKSAQWQANIDTLTNELRASIEDYEKKKNRLSDKEKQLNEQLIHTKQQQLQQYREGIQAKVQQEDQQLSESVLEEINGFISEYGKKKGYKIILGATELGNVVYAQEGLDITDEVIAEINKQYNR